MAKTSLANWIKEGPFTLALSSSFFGFFAHCGVASALFERNAIPAKITGSSAGALVGGALASGLRPETMRDILFRAKREDFWDPHPGLGYLRGKKFLHLVEQNFVSDFSQTKIPFEAAAFDLLALRTRFLKEGNLPQAVVASCAVPLLFHPVKIGRSFFIDGGVFHKSGINPQSDSERVLCIFLQGEGKSDAYELSRSLKKIGKSQRVIRFQNLPRLNYNSLENGKHAYAEAYRRSRESFENFFQGSILDA